MIKHFLIIAVRNLRKHKFYTLINVFGLTIGITACMVILLFVRFELSYDRHHEHAERIYRVEREVQFGINYDKQAATHAPLAETMLQEFPEVEAAARFRWDGSHKLRYGTNNFVETRIVYTDNDLFRIFTIPFLEGNPATCLVNPNTMVVSREFANRIFPGESALNKMLVLDDKTTYEITGIFEDIPDANHFHYSVFLSMAGLEESKKNEWLGGPFVNYILLHKGADPKALEAKLPILITKYVLPQASQAFGADFVNEFFTAGNKLNYSLKPLLDIHLYSHLENELDPNGDIAYVILFSSIAIFILVIACINFMNLTTARSVTRSREVGVRKVLGSGKNELIRQFLAESIILSLISFLLAVFLTGAVLPAFNNLANKHLSLPWNSDLMTIYLIPVAILIGILAGLYPAFVLSSFKPIDVLKGKVIKGTHSGRVRMGLVVFQFFISIFLIINTLTIYKQLNHVQNINLGFNKDQVLLIRDVYDLDYNSLQTVKTEIEKNAFIRSGTISSYFPGPESARQTPLMWLLGASSILDNSFNFEKWMVDYDYIPTLGMTITEGRNFSRDFPSDTSAVILNETAIKNLGIADDPIGRIICVSNEDPEKMADDDESLEKWTIVGVVGDFTFNSFQENIAPLGLFFGKSNSTVAFRFDSKNTGQVIETIRDTWHSMMPGQPFNYTFLDENFAKTYDFEQRLGKLFGVFTGLAIIIACLGLFALTAFVTQQRTKEIGIRKILGARVSDILVLLSGEFNRLILLAFIIAVPFAWYSINWWLQHYAYKTQVGISVYLGAGLIVLFLGLATMAFQSAKAANANPVDSLRTE